MAYSQNGQIQAIDINGTIVGIQSPSAPSGTLNSMWGVGNGDRGYGQPVYVTNVLNGDRVLNTEWNSIIGTTDSIALHQGTQLISNPAHPVGKLISFDRGITLTNVTDAFGKRLNARLQGAPVTLTRTSTSTWINACTFDFVVNLGTANQSRYFFNCGGQIKFDFLHPNGSGINGLFSALGVACGSVWISAARTGKIQIGATSFDGVTKIGGSGTPDILSKDSGYYGLTTTWTPIFRQLGTNVMPGYSNSNITILARTSGSIGSSGDNGNLIYFNISWDQIPNGARVSTGTSVTATVVTPAAAGIVSGAVLSQSWGSPTISGTVSAI